MAVYYDCSLFMPSHCVYFNLICQRGPVIIRHDRCGVCVCVCQKPMWFERGFGLSSSKRIYRGNFLPPKIRWQLEIKRACPNCFCTFCNLVSCNLWKTRQLPLRWLSRANLSQFPFFHWPVLPEKISLSDSRVCSVRWFSIACRENEGLYIDSSKYILQNRLVRHSYTWGIKDRSPPIHPNYAREQNFNVLLIEDLFRDTLWRNQ